MEELSAEGMGQKKVAEKRVAIEIVKKTNPRYK